jgi:hypothetical protein
VFPASLLAANIAFDILTRKALNTGRLPSRWLNGLEIGVLSPPPQGDRISHFRRH